MTATSHLHSWLENAVHNYWGKKERLSRVIYKVQVSENDYDTLETQLTEKFPDRHCQQYDSSRHSQTSDNLKLRCLLSLKRCQEDDNEDEDTDSFTILDMQDISSGIKGPFSLPVILVRKEYRVFRKLVMAGRYNSFVTGQPGIGKTYFLFFVLVTFVLEGRPFLFVSKGVKWYIDNGSVAPVSRVPLPALGKGWIRDPLVILIDGDGKDDQYQPEFQPRNYRVIMVTSLWDDEHRDWVKRKAIGSVQELAMQGWNAKELRFASSFLYEFDTTPSRLANSIRLFGRSPPVCFAAATGSNGAAVALNSIKSAVQGVPDIPAALLSYRMGTSVLHTLLEVIPQDERRLWVSVAVRPVSGLALDLLFHDQVERSGQSVYDLYSELRTDLWRAAMFIEMTWERVLHRYLSQVQGHFELTPLDSSHPPYTLHLSQPFHIYDACSTDIAFRSTLLKAFDSDGSVTQSCHAHADTPALDSVAIVGSNFLGFQTATGSTHSMKLIALQRAQRWLKIGTPLEKFCPSKDNKWNIIFMVPSTLKGKFPLQSIDDSTASLWKPPKAQTLTSSKKGRSNKQKHKKRPVIANPDFEDSGVWGNCLYQYAWFVDEKDVFPAYATYLEEDFDSAFSTVTGYN